MKGRAKQVARYGLPPLMPSFARHTGSLPGLPPNYGAEQVPTLDCPDQPDRLGEWALGEQLEVGRCPACRVVIHFHIDTKGVYFRCHCTGVRQRLTPG